MSENSRRFIQAMYALDAVAKRVPAAMWDNQSCCSEWTAREVAGHAAWVIQNVGAACGTNDRPEEQSEAEVAGSDPAATLAAAIAAACLGLDTQGALQIVSQTPFGEMPVDNFVGILWVDPLAHAWDIADATGTWHGIDDQTADAAYEAMLPFSDGIRGPGMFGAAIDGGSDSVERFISFIGRSPVGA